MGGLLLYFCSSGSVGVGVDFGVGVGVVSACGSSCSVGGSTTTVSVSIRGFWEVLDQTLLPLLRPPMNTFEIIFIMMATLSLIGCIGVKEGLNKPHQIQNDGKPDITIFGIHGNGHKESVLESAIWDHWGSVMGKVVGSF